MKSIARTLTASFLFAAAGAAQALTLQAYSPEALAKAQAAGQPVALQFHADWCPTCRAQDKAFARLKDDKDLKLTIFVANYDKEIALEKQLKVRVQSTLIMYHGSKETYRISGVTDDDAIREALMAAFDKAH